MKLIVQIPCLNEESTLTQTIAEIPRHIDGVDVVDVLVIDGGSTDETARGCRRKGAIKSSQQLNQDLAGD